MNKWVSGQEWDSLWPGHFLLQGFHLMDDPEKDSVPPEGGTTGRREDGSVLQDAER